MAKKITVNDFDFKNVESLSSEEYSQIMSQLYDFVDNNSYKATRSGEIFCIGSGSRWIRFFEKDGAWWTIFNHPMWGWSLGGATTTVPGCQSLDEKFVAIRDHLAFEEILKK